MLPTGAQSTRSHSRYVSGTGGGRVQVAIILGPFELLTCDRSFPESSKKSASTHYSPEAASRRSHDQNSDD